jgi:transposase
LGDLPIQVYNRHDGIAETTTMTMLARTKLASHVEIATAFGVHRNTVGRLVDRVERGGMPALVPAKRGPKGPHKVTAQVRTLIEANSGLSSAQLQALVAEQTGIKLSAAYVRDLRIELRRLQLELPVQAAADQEGGEELVVEPAAATDPAVCPLPEPTPTAVDAAAAPAAPEAATAQLSETVAPALEPSVMLPEQARARYLGAALYYPALEALGLLKAASACFRLPGADLFGVRATILTLFFLALLSKTTVEAAKQLRRWELGPLIGTDRAPVVKTLRRKLAALIALGQASRFGQLLVQRWVEQGVVATAYLYIDGHMKAYTGKRHLQEVYNSQRRMPLPGFHTYFVNDQQSRPLLFVTEEAGASLTQAMPKLVAAIREAVGDRPFTIIFDRGGFDGELFNWLQGEGIDFITYQVGDPNLPLERFHRRECHFEGRRVRMRLAEDTVTVAGSGPWRRIVVRAPNGHQVPILTSLNGVAPAKIACRIFARWRQENFFKYMCEHLGLDQLLGYAYQQDDGARLVPNPERKKLDQELKQCRRELALLRAELGQALLDEPRDSLRSTHGLKIAQRGAVGQVRALEDEIEAILDVRSALPERVPLAEAGQRQVLRMEQKAIVDRIKITAYNAEEWTLDRLLPHYPNPHDIRALLRSFVELSGEMRSTPDGVLITLDAPDIPLHRRALRGLCDDLNQAQAIYPGTDLPLTYRVAMHHSEVRT